VASAALEKKASNVLILDLRKLETIADYFVICTGDVDQQVRAIVENIERQVRTDTGERVMHREGMDTMNWVLLDYVDVVVHVFKPSFREFYRLEDLWGDADTVAVDDEGQTAAKPKTVRRRVAVAAAKPETEKAPAKRVPAKKTTARAKTATKSAAKSVRKPAAKKVTKTPAAKKTSAPSSASKRPRKSNP
jgi:ribosome-associated protein